ncbi:DUF3800 domain-containing protein [Phaeobacter piscinae]|uniref:DUF3800 domain-containing protein n=1 Tax=Phaeobacter piscinae TaxID=1580596 RepID=A0AAN1LAN9_9RHOB|nr:DUF3800 domain-containing protein [Phaeobacter piscinae]ATG43680.1 hypothetical protein PhaeoP13_01743 [Phaeobacter piscinae]
MRFIYVDEAGTSKNEPYFIACGVISDPDECYLSVRQYYFDLSNDLFPEWEGFGDSVIFHAKDIWHGAGHWDRKKWPKRERMNILKRLVQVPVLFQLPLCFGILEKAGVAESLQVAPDTTAKQREKLLARSIYSHGIHGMLQVADWWMAKNCPSELAQVVAEDISDVKGAMAMFFSGLQKQDHDIAEDLAAASEPDWFVTERFIDTINYVAKSKSPMLQVADTFAFLVRRMLGGCAEAASLIEPASSWFVTPTNLNLRTARLIIPVDQVRPVD